jgi:hypothetical protein
MKHLIFFLFFASSAQLFAQIYEPQSNDRRPEIWNSIVQSIIAFDEVKIAEATHFPLEGSWYMDEGQTPEELKKLYLSELDYFYPQQMRDYLDKKNFTILVAHPDKGKVAFAFTFFDEIMESTTLVDFAEVDGKWKIVAISIK